MNKKWLLGLLGLLVVLSVISLLVGRLEFFTEENRGLLLKVIASIRLPRLMGTILVGSLLSIVGAMYQAVYRNPIIDAYIMGTPSTFMLGLVLALSVGTQGDIASVIGLILSLGVTLLVWVVSKLRGVKTALLFGIGITFIASSLIQILLITRPLDYVRISSLLLGSVVGIGYNEIIRIIIIGVVYTGILLYMSKSIDYLRLGEKRAKSMGVDVDNLQAFLIIINSIVVSVLVYYTGIVGFIGIMTPNIIRKYTRGRVVDYVVMSILIGPSTLLLGDLLLRVLFKAEIPLGISSAILGVPAFMSILLRGGRYDRD